MERGAINPTADVATIHVAELRSRLPLNATTATAASVPGLQPLGHSETPHERSPVLELRGEVGDGSGGAAIARGLAEGVMGGWLGRRRERSAKGGGAKGGVGDGRDGLSWLSLGGFRTTEWRAPLPRRFEAFLRAPGPRGLALHDSQVTIVKTCLRSLATSRE